MALSFLFRTNTGVSCSLNATKLGATAVISRFWVRSTTTPSMTSRSRKTFSRISILSQFSQRTQRICATRLGCRSPDVFISNGITPANQYKLAGKKFQDTLSKKRGFVTLYPIIMIRKTLDFIQNIHINCISSHRKVRFVHNIISLVCVAEKIRQSVMNVTVVCHGISNEASGDKGRPTDMPRPSWKEYRMQSATGSSRIQAKASAYRWSCPAYLSVSSRSVLIRSVL